MKKIIIWTFVLILLSNFVSATIFFNDSFNRADSATLGNGWSEAGEGATRAYRINNSQFQMRATTQPGLDTFANHNVTTPSDSFKINFSLFLNVLPINTGVDIGTYDGGTRMGVLRVNAGNGQFRMRRPGGWDDLFPYSAGREYKIEFGFFTSNTTYNTTINGTFYGTRNLENAATMTRVRILTNLDTTVNYFIDDFFVFNETITPPPPPVSNSINLSSATPINNESFNFNPINFSVVANASLGFNCSLFINSTLNLTQTGFNSGTDIQINFSQSFTDEGSYNYFINCSNGTTSAQTSTNNFFFDVTNPVIVTDLINNSMHYIDNLTAQFNISDNIMLFKYNITIDDVLIEEINDLNETFRAINFTRNVQNLSLGNHSLVFTVADGHTAHKLGDDYDVSNGLFNNYLKYKFYDGGYAKIKGLPSSIFDDFSSSREKDRYTFIYKPNVIDSNSYSFEVESDLPIYIVSNPKTEYKKWLIMGDHWLDFYLPNEPKQRVSLTKINNNKVIVEVTGISNPREQLYSSIGDLNVVQQEFIFYNINLTETFNPLILSNFSFSLNLSVDLGNLLFDISGITPVALLEFNGTNFSTTLVNFNTSEASFNRNFTGSFSSSLPEGIINHTWFFNFTNLTSGFINTTETQQEKITVDVGICNANLPHPVINMSYFDEINSSIALDVTNAFDLRFFDGTFNYNVTSSFVGNTTDILCTNLNPLNITYNWDLFGTFTLSKSTYVTRILEFDAGNQIPVSNNPPSNQSFFLIKINESSTIIFNWLTIGYQPIDGTMRVFKCNPDGTRSLTESLAVTGGSTGANSPSLQLLTQAYAYDIIIGGVIFEDLVSYSKCHVETQSERTYYVNVDETDISGILGLYSVDCSLDKVSNNSVFMSWGSNPEDSTYVSGCVKVDRNTINGSTTIFDNCTVESDGFSRTIILPIASGNTFSVSGRLEQGNTSSFCRDVVIFTPADIVGGLFSITGLFGAFLLILSLALMFSSDGEIAIFVSIVGIIASWIIGIINMPWIYASALISFLIIIVLIGRHSRKSG